MKNFTLLILILFSWQCHAQLAEEGFEGSWAPASSGTGASSWLALQNTIGTNLTWTQTNAANPSTPAYQGAHAAYLNKVNVSSGLAADYLVTPVFDAPAGGEVHFHSRLTIAGDQGGQYYVKILPEGEDASILANYITLQQWSETQVNPVQNEYLEKTVLIPDQYLGTEIRIAFVMEGDDMDRWLIDNVKVVSPCLAPGNLVAVNPGLTTAELGWNNNSGASAWEIAIMPDVEAFDGTGILFTGPASYYATAADGLEMDGNYKFYVRGYCSDGGVSDWIGPTYFVTLKPGDKCEIPISFSSLPFSTNDTTANYSDMYEGASGNGCGTMPWEISLQGNDAVYEFTSSFTGTVSIDLTNNGNSSNFFVYDECEDIGINCLAGASSGFIGGPISVPALSVMQGETYYIVVSSFMTLITPYTLVMQQVNCEKPVGMPVTAIGMNSAQLSWTNPSSSNSWEVAVQPSGTGIPAGPGIQVSATTYLAQGLQPLTVYEYYVRANCGDGTFSAWAGPYNFTTNVCNVENQCSYTFQMYSVTPFGWGGSTMTVTQDGYTAANLELPFGQSASLTIPVCDGIPLEVFWNNDGFSPESVGLKIFNSFGQQIFDKLPGSGLQGSNIYAEAVDCNNVACVAPSTLNAYDTDLNSAVLSWDGPVAGTWEYYIVGQGQPGPSDTVSGVPTTTNPVTAGGLQQSTEYQYYVRMLCDSQTGEFTQWGGPHAFSTSVCPISEKCDYTFVISSNWPLGYDGAVMTVSQDNTTVAVLGESLQSFGSQSVTVPLCHNVPVELEWSNGGGNPNAVGIAIVNPFGQTIYAKDTGEGIPGTILFDDLINCNEPVCLTPDNLSAYNATMTSVMLDWEAVGTSAWEYFIVGQGQPGPSEGTEGIFTDSKPVAATVAPATNYQYYVRSVCENAATGLSAWAGPYDFSTQVCDDGDKCNYIFELTSEIGWGWEGNEITVFQNGVPAANIGESFFFGSSVSIEVALCPDAETEIVWNLGGANPFDKGLTVYTPFLNTFYVKPPLTGEQGTTLFTGMTSCLPPACPVVQNLSATQLQETAALLNWQEMGTAVAWELWVVPHGSALPDTEGEMVNQNPYLWEGLQPGTAYDFYVRASCDENGVSEVSSPKSFVTALINDHCEGSIPVPVNPTMECGTSVDGSLNGATPSGTSASCMFGFPASDVWYKFVATSNSHSIYFTGISGTSFQYAIYSGNDCAAINEIYCQGIDSQMYNILLGNLQPGNTYYLQLFTPNPPPDGVLSTYNLCIRTPEPYVSVEPMPALDLIESMFISECAQVSNVVSSTGNDFGSHNGIAYFNSNGSSFPLEEGIVLCTGITDQVPGPYNNNALIQDTFDWPGDPDIEALLQPLGYSFPTFNASKIEFDFVPSVNRFDFEFLFASTLYPYNQCQDPATVAFFLTDSQGNTQNIALVPGTSDIVSATTIRPQTNGINSCSGYNEEYFGQLNFEDIFATPIGYAGQTKVMTAGADIVPGEAYHVKMIIADYRNFSPNSAVFFTKANFSTSIDLGPDMLIATNNAVCSNQSATLDSGLNEQGSYRWFKDNVEIVGQTAPSITVNEPGTYKIQANYLDPDCGGEDEIVVEFYPPAAQGTQAPENLYSCESDGFGSFDLSLNSDIILTGAEGSFTISYHLSEADAADNVNPLPSLWENTVQNEQTIFVRIDNTTTGCYSVRQFKVIAQEILPQFTLDGELAFCENAQGSIAIIPVNFELSQAQFSWNYNGIPLDDTGDSITVNQSGTYQASVMVNGCVSLQTVNVTAIPLPELAPVENITSCAQYILPELNAGNYYTEPGGLGLALAPGDAISQTGTVYIYAESDTMPSCSNEVSFTVTIQGLNPSVAVFSLPGVLCLDGGSIVPELSPGFTDGGIYSATNGLPIDSDTGAVDTDNANPGTYTITYTVFQDLDACRAAATYNLTITLVEEEVVEIRGGCHSGSYLLTVTGNGQYLELAQYTWKNSLGEIISTEGPDFNYGAYAIQNAMDVVFPVEVAVEIRVGNCLSVQKIIIEGIECTIQRGISPNGDGLNDNFDLSDLNVSSLSIYNRYGREVYSKYAYKDEWHGQDNSENDLPTGTYYYVIELPSRENISGWIYINKND